MSLTRVVIAVAVLIASAAPAMAQNARTLDISFEGGMVTLVAENVTLREILAEWARKGGSRIVNAERLGGSPVYLTEFKGQPEADVLRALLREAPGYGVSMRDAPAAGTSTVGTVMILATRTVPVSTSSVSAPVSSQPQFQSARPQAAPRLIQGSPDDQIPPVQPVGNMPPSTQGPAANNPNLRTGQGGIVTSTVPGVVIPVQGDPSRMGGPGSPTAPPILPPGRGRGGGGGGR
ncbi:MAG: hypothetical protein NUW22_05525 [Acidobacteria bacterium]|nr:hypothetical protein [Acidobacteriota bacterium]